MTAKKRVYKIYCLYADDDIFYVGITTRPLSERLLMHKSAVRSKLCGNGLKNKKIKIYGDNVKIKELEELRGTKVAAYNKEKEWIAEMYKNGYDLCNAECVKPEDRIFDETRYEAIKINKKVVELVRQNKKLTRVPISAFFEKAALNELKFQQKK